MTGGAGFDTTFFVCFLACRLFPASCSLFGARVFKALKCSRWVSREYSRRPHSRTSHSARGLRSEPNLLLGLFINFYFY